ncbi:hypothetical protein HID58_006925 [Brassica napus]|uniref:Uncharacterized protein n=1 Tax=Brassica napus TaxID=3708 RepID=A0ABQ8ECR8_BRANA|nr:hypothetical protein HID58_006925 [Brassica napus]
MDDKRGKNQSSVSLSGDSFRSDLVGFVKDAGHRGKSSHACEQPCSQQRGASDSRHMTERDRSDDPENSYASFQGLLALARITGSNNDEARGSWRRLGGESESEDSDVDSEIEKIIAERYGKKKKGSGSSSSVKKNKKKRDESESESDSGDRKRRRRSKKRRTHKRRSVSESEEEEEDGRSKRRKERRGRKRDDDDSDESSDEDRRSVKRKSRKEKRRRRSRRNRSDDSDSSEDDASGRRQKRRNKVAASSDSDVSGDDEDSRVGRGSSKRYEKKSRKRHHRKDGSLSDIYKFMPPKLKPQRLHQKTDAEQLVKKARTMTTESSMKAAFFLYADYLNNFIEPLRLGIESYRRSKVETKGMNFQFGNSDSSSANSGMRNERERVVKVSRDITMNSKNVIFQVQRPIVPRKRKFYEGGFQAAMTQA